MPTVTVVVRSLVGPEAFDRRSALGVEPGYSQTVSSEDESRPSASVCRLKAVRQFS